MSSIICISTDPVFSPLSSNTNDSATRKTPIGSVSHDPTSVVNNKPIANLVSSDKSSTSSLPFDTTVRYDKPCFSETYALLFKSAWFDFYELSFNLCLHANHFYDVNFKFQLNCLKFLDVKSNFVYCIHALLFKFNFGHHKQLCFHKYLST